MHIALTRAISPTIDHAELTHVARVPIDLARAEEQHAAYEQLLSDLGCTVRRIDPDELAALLKRARSLLSIGDITSAKLFEEILADEEHHIDYIETNLELMGKLGEQLYLAQLVHQPPVPG